jgi:FAD dependent oxidoreductase
MKHRIFMLGLISLALQFPAFGQAAPAAETFDVVVIGGTAGGVTSAIAAAREGMKVLLLERTGHIGGLPANGLGATDIWTRGATMGLFGEFLQGNLDYYTRTYGKESKQVRDSEGGYHFEPSVAEKTFLALLAREPRVTVRFQRQFDALPANVTVTNARLCEIKVLNRQSGALEPYRAKVFIDATYEGDLAAAAGVPYRLGREALSEFNEPMAGQLYTRWGGGMEAVSSRSADNAVQAYNYRLTLTKDPKLRVPIPKPTDYRREDYASIIEDLRANRSTAGIGTRRPEMDWDGIGRVVNMVPLPNGKVDANNQHAAFVSTDLPEENWPWPTSTWAWRDSFAERLRNYTLGLLWFAQNDPELPASFRQRSQEWGLARDEYTDNGNFPRQVYVREGRRICGEYFFTAHDALSKTPGGRPPVHDDSITASHYALDSHPVRKREPGRVNLDGIFSFPTQPYTVPYGVIVPVKVDGLLTPVPVSATHVGFGTLRMEPCWMGLGQAAGIAASFSIKENIPVRRVDVHALQAELLKQKAVLLYYRDVNPGDPHFTAVQVLGLRGFLPEWKAELDKPVTEETAREWLAKVQPKHPIQFVAGKTSRGELLEKLYESIKQ